MNYKIISVIVIIVFAGLFTIPLWMNMASGSEADMPVLEYPEGYDQCIESKEYMKAYHMDVLNDWRDLVVRDDIRFAEFNGQQWEMSLSKTCMSCHSNKEAFCDRCHDYLGVVPYCWDCHIMPQEVDREALKKEAEEQAMLEKAQKKPCCEKHAKEEAEEEGHHDGQADTDAKESEEVKQ